MSDLAATEITNQSYNNALATLKGTSTLETLAEFVENAAKVFGSVGSKAITTQATIAIARINTATGVDPAEIAEAILQPAKEEIANHSALLSQGDSMIRYVEPTRAWQTLKQMDAAEQAIHVIFSIRAALSRATHG